MLETLQIKKSELSILLTDDNQIHILNRDFRHTDRATDVLAFAMREGEAGDVAGDMLGDVVISLETAARQAEEHGHSLREEAVFLLGHGLLHLLGWDHDTPAKDRAMRAETDRLCIAVGVPAPARAGGGYQAGATVKRATKVKKRAPQTQKASSSTARKTVRKPVKSLKRARRKSE